MTVAEFRTTVWAHYRANGRHDLPWRLSGNPYRILVSEVMLQQTQVDRVVPKYRAFLKAFPTLRALAAATNADVLKLWSGLGYNRRALFLKRAAETVVREYGGRLPKTAEELENLPGVGPYTARAVATFSHNAPYIFIETNIRAAFIHAFFPHRAEVSDTELMPRIEQALPKARPREWYWALMDYGAYLKKTLPNPSRKSAHHVRQSPFKGSDREVRGAFVRRVTQGSVTVRALLAPYSGADRARARHVLDVLVAEGFLTISPRGRVTIS